MGKDGLKSFDVGESFTGFCIVRKTELKYKHDGKAYLSLDLGDKSGRMPAKIWRGAEEYYGNLKAGQLVKIKGKIQNYMERKELHVERIRIATKEEEAKIEEMVPVSQKDVKLLKEKFSKHLQAIENEYLQELLQIILPDDDALESYLKMPSGKLWHHNYLYGSLEHLVCLLDLSDVLIDHYPAIQKDLFKSAIILHNIGNDREHDYYGFIDYTTEGRLIGHVVLGYQLVQSAIDRIENFPENLRLQLLHLILSHEGNREKTSAVMPMTLEGILLNLLDEVDVRANAATRIIKYDRVPESEWTRYNNLFERFIYVGNEAGDHHTGKQNK